MKPRNIIISAGIIIILLILIEIFASINESTRFFVGAPSTIISILATNIYSGQLIKDSLITGIEVILGFVIGVSIGTFAGFILWYNRNIAETFSPYIFVAGIIPVVIFAPIIIIWFGIGMTMKIALAAFTTFLISLSHSYNGAKSVDENQYSIFKIYGGNRKQIFQKVILPSSLSWVIASMRMNVGFAFLGAIIGEFVAAQDGLGHFMFLEGSLYNMPAVFAGSICMIVLALIFNLAVTLIEKRDKEIIRIISVNKILRNASKKI